MWLPSMVEPGLLLTTAKGKPWGGSACSVGDIVWGLCDPALPHYLSFSSLPISHLWVLLMFVGMPINLVLSEVTGFG